jgi:hypothetical protein
LERGKLQMAQISTMGTSQQVAQNMEGCFLFFLKKLLYVIDSQNWLNLLMGDYCHFH